MFKKLFKKTKYITVSSNKLEIQNDSEVYEDKHESKPNIPNWMWVKCNKCGQIIYTKDLKRNNKVCGFCNNYFSMSAYERIKLVVDEETWEETDKNVLSVNPLSFKGYEEKIEKLQKDTDLKEAVVTGIGNINDQKAVICVMDNSFLMGSMGSVVGEKITRAIERAIEEKLPVIIFTTSGGARMQEGIYSLMQMAKVSSALSKLDEAGLLYITVLTNPTTGGVTASFAMLGDIIISEPEALIGFAGRRVIEQTIKEKLPKGFQKSEFLLEHGFIDKIVEREKIKITLGKILKLHKHKKINVQNNYCKDYKYNVIKDSLEAWDKVKLVRKNERPTALDYINRIFNFFMEFHGDRYFGDDDCIVGGIGTIDDIPVTIIAQQKGRSLQEKIKRNFGMPNPEGYRKALRLMKQAEKFKRPIICFVDTPGAYCGIGAEERGQGEAIAENLMIMSSLKVPIISIFIGEGGSGGALALAVSDRIWMLENSIYSLLSPEGFASILWKDAKRCKEAASVMKITAKDLKEFGIIDKVLKEPYGDVSKDLITMCDMIKNNLLQEIFQLSELSMEQLVSNRYDKFRRIGKYVEPCT